jgi:hypothetical protein
MAHFTIQLQISDRLYQTPITPEDIEDILALLGHGKPEITAATIVVSQSHATVHWTPQQNPIAA